MVHGREQECHQTDTELEERGEFWRTGKRTVRVWWQGQHLSETLKGEWES